MAVALGAERFLTEIRTAANLQHPHILPMFDSREAGGLLYYVMPYVEGESLREGLDREGQLPVEEVLEIARPLADALEYAHRHGIEHRDLKPSKVILHEGRLYLVDVGVALAMARAESEDRLTEIWAVGSPRRSRPP